MEDIISATSCLLPPQDAQAQALEWADLRGIATSSQLAAKGVRLTFPSDAEEALQSLVARERKCCPAFRFSIEHRGEWVMLEVTSEDPQARSAIVQISGVVT